MTLINNVHPGTVDVAVVGGGLAGLATATMLARAGRKVALFEQAHAVGGRAISTRAGDFTFNLGPHAIYRVGTTARVLHELGVRYSGQTVPAEGVLAIHDGTLHKLPGGPMSLLTTRLLDWRAKLEAGWLLTMFPRINARTLDNVSLEEWLGREVRHPRLRSLIETLARVTTYTHDPMRLSAGVAVTQIQLTLKASVCYVDGGWQTLVDGLRVAAERAGVVITTGAKVVAIERDAAVRGVRLADGTLCEAQAVVVAASPANAAELLADGSETPLHSWATKVTPVQLATLNLGLRRLPRPKHIVALGVDRPVYYSVHSAFGRLAPEGAAMIHVAKYLQPGVQSHAQADERELEGVMDLVQPGWRDEVVERRFLPHLTVSNAEVMATAGGLPGRPGPAVPDVPGLYVVGDWVGTEGLLADASLASAAKAAELIMQSAAVERHPQVQYAYA